VPWLGLKCVVITSARRRRCVTGRGGDGADYGVSSRWSRGLRPYSLLKAVLSAKAVE